MGAQYLIHSVPKRRWYVENFLVPSMVRQGIKRYNIIIYFDSKGLGNRKAFFDSLRCISKLSDEWGTWHIQDDIIISPNFREETEKHNKGIVNGFCSNLYDDKDFVGYVDKIKLWKGFQCIRLPNKLIHDSMVWGEKYIVGNPIYREYWENGANDDWIFRQYLKSSAMEEPVLNLCPNIVEHVDYLLGGSTVCNRANRLYSQYWDYPEIVKQLESDIEKFTTTNL